MAEPWNKEFELSYVRHTSMEELNKRSREHAAIFGIEPKWIHTSAVIMEVGCGAAGGLLSLFSPSHQLFAVDPLIDEYLALGWLPLLNETRAEFAHELSAEDNSVDYLFAVEVLDHCRDAAEFQKSLEQFARVLAPQGQLFFMLPSRPTGEHDGHPCAQIGQPLIEMALQQLGLETVRNRFSREGSWLHMKKPQR